MTRPDLDSSFLDGLDRGEPFVPVPLGRLVVRLAVVLVVVAAVVAVWGVIGYGFFRAVTA